MSTFVAVEDPADPRVADYARLCRPHVRQHLGTASGLVVLEGRRAIEALLAGGRTPQSVLTSPEKAASLAPLLAELPVPIFVAARPVLDSLAGYPVHRGILGLARRWAPPHARALLDGARCLVLLEGVGDHENVGAIFRSAAALGADGVLFGPRCADPLYRRAIRVSMGQTLRLPFADAQPWPALLDELCAAGWLVVGLAPKADTPLARVVPGRDQPVALLLGNEADGLSDPARLACSLAARVPMTPGSDSLNVAAAAAVALSWLGPLADHPRQ